MIINRESVATWLYTFFHFLKVNGGDKTFCGHKKDSRSMVSDEFFAHVRGKEGVLNMATTLSYITC
jgi:hypothetical protein